jgi:tellurite resistance protein TerC
VGSVAWWVWGVFGAFVVAMLVVDLLAFGRRGETVSFRRALWWSIGWTALGLGFAAFLFVWKGNGPAEEFLAGFVIEKSLSIDNLFVFALIFSYFAVPAAYQRRVIYWGIIGAIVLRGVFIAAGAALLDAFHFVVYVFGAFLVVTGVRMARHSNVEIHPERNPALRLLGRIVPLTTSYHEDKLFAREQRGRVATPLLAALVLVAAFDVVFAVDSIPAIFAITEETFIVYAANAFSLLGLSALYFVLAGMIGRFRYLNIGLAVILVFVGAKMLLADLVHIPVYLSLTVIVVTLAVAVGASLRQAPPGGLQEGSDDVSARSHPRHARSARGAHGDSTV